MIFSNQGYKKQLPQWIRVEEEEEFTNVNSNQEQKEREASSQIKVHINVMNEESPKVFLVQNTNQGEDIGKSSPT